MRRNESTNFVLHFYCRIYELLTSNAIEFDDISSFGNIYLVRIIIVLCWFRILLIFLISLSCVLSMCCMFYWHITVEFFAHKGNVRCAVLGKTKTTVFATGGDDGQAHVWRYLKATPAVVCLVLTG